MATTNKALTARDKAHVRKTARELHAAYEMGEDDSTSETVMLSSGYADVEIYPGEEKFAYVVRHGRTTRVSMSGPTALGWPRKAGRKTATRKRVSSKKTANPDRKEHVLRAKYPGEKWRTIGRFDSASAARQSSHEFERHAPKMMTEVVVVPWGGRTPNPSKRKRAARKTSRRPKAKRKANGQFARKSRRR